MGKKSRSGSGMNHPGSYFRERRNSWVKNTQILWCGSGSGIRVEKFLGDQACNDTIFVWVRFRGEQRVSTYSSCFLTQKWVHQTSFTINVIYVITEIRKKNVWFLWICGYFYLEWSWVFLVARAGAVLPLGSGPGGHLQRDEAPAPYFYSTFGLLFSSVSDR